MEGHAFTLDPHLLASFCHKVLITLYENDIQFETSLVDFSNPGSAAAHTERWPVSKIPVVHDSNGNRVVAETSIMIEYVQQHYSGPLRLIPANPDLQLDTRLWDRFFDLYVSMPMQKIVGDRIRPKGAEDAHGVAEAHATLETTYDMVEGQLYDGRCTIRQSFTIADRSALPALFFATIVHPPGDSRPKLGAYLERLPARPSVERVLGEEQPYFKFFPYRGAMPAHYLEPAQ
jgi:glutathione S-transferase